MWTRFLLYDGFFGVFALGTHFKKFKDFVEKKIGKQIKMLRSDGGGEYFSSEFFDFLQKSGIRRQFSCRYTPQQNGVADRKNTHIAEVARALMAEKSMPHHYWAEAVNRSEEHTSELQSLGESRMPSSA